MAGLIAGRAGETDEAAAADKEEVSRCFLGLPSPETVLRGPRKTRDIAGAVWSPLSKKNRGGGQTRTEVADDHLTIYPTGNLDDFGEFQWETRGPLYTSGAV